MGGANSPSTRLEGEVLGILYVGIDLAKNVFAVHGVDEHGKAVLVRPSVARAKLHDLIETVVQAMREDRIPAGLNTHRMALADMPQNFPMLLDPGAGVVKAIVEC